MTSTSITQRLLISIFILMSLEIHFISDYEKKAVLQHVDV